MAHKTVFAYGHWPTLPENIQWIAQHFDLCCLGIEGVSAIAPIKALNPNILIIVYADLIAMHEFYPDWSEVNQHEDWFCHDINGNRIRHQLYRNWYLMDIGSGWREYYAQRCKTWIETYGLDGIFADDVWHQFRYGCWLIPDSDIPPSIAENWFANMEASLRHVKAVIGNKLLIPNTKETTTFPYITDGLCWEHFIRKSTWDLDTFSQTPYWRPFIDGGIDALAEITRKGRIFFAHSGALVPSNPTSEELQKIHDVALYTFCSFLLGNNGDGYWSFNRVDHPIKGYIPELDYNFGNPRSDVYQVAENIFGRDYDHAKVFVNFTDDQTYEITVNETVYQLPPRRGLIAPWEATPIPKTFSLVVASVPVTGIPVSVDTLQYTTPTSSLTLPEGLHVVTVPSNVEIDSAVYNFVQWEDSSTNPTRTINLIGDMTITCTYQLKPPPPPAKGSVEIHAFLDSQEIVAPYEIVNATSGNTPSTVELNVGNYTINVTYQEQTKTQTIQIVEGQQIRVDFQFGTTPTPRAPMFPVIVGKIIQYPVLAKIYYRIIGQ